MPSITCDKVELDKLYGAISDSVVTIRRYNGSRFVNFGSGFIIHSTEFQNLVCTHQSTIKRGEDTYVCYSDGTSRQAFVFIKDSKYGHAVLSVSRRPGEPKRSAVTFSEAKVKREEICTVARVKHDGEPGMMSGIVVAPDGKTVLRSGSISTKNENKFALTCPYYGSKGKVHVEANLIGAAVFALNRSVVGTINSAEEEYDLKFAIHTSSFLDELNGLVHGKLKKVSHSRGARASKVLHVDNKRKRSHEGQPCQKRVKYAAEQKMKDWCEGSAW